MGNGFGARTHLAQQALAELPTATVWPPRVIFWIDDLPSLARLGVLEKMKEQPPPLWVILAGAKTLTEPNWRCRIVAAKPLAVRTHLGALPIAVFGGKGEAPAPQMAPPLLKNALFLALDSPAWQAKIVGLANRPSGRRPADYYLDVYGDRQVGQWFEVGPASERWQGALFAVAGAEIDFHGVGPPRQAARAVDDQLLQRVSS